MPQQQYAIGIDIGGTNTKVGIVSQDGVIIKKDHFKTCAHQDFDFFLHSLIHTLQPLMFDTHVIGVGVGAPNVNGLTGWVINPPNLSWGTFDLRSKLQATLNLPVQVDNDANIAALSEMVWGNAKNCRNFVCVTLGTGVGTGVVVDGKILHSTYGAAGEGGHITVEIDGRMCGCGRKGHLEAYASALGIQNTMTELTNLEVVLPELTNMLNQGNEKAIQVYDYTAKMLGAGLANMASLLYPEKIILTGGVSAAGPAFLKMVQKYFDQLCFPSFADKISIELSTSSSQDGAILGAASLIFSGIASNSKK